jgi:hypothetical protein
MLAGLPPATLVVADIGFCQFDLIWALCARDIDFFIRVGGNTTLLTEVRRNAIERSRDHRYASAFYLGLPCA